MIIKTETDTEIGEFANFRRNPYTLDCRPLVVTEFINISKANSISFSRDEGHQIGTITIKFAGEDSIRIEDVSAVEWSFIQDSWVKDIKGVFDLSKFRKENEKFFNNNHLHGLNPNDYLI